MKKSCFVLILFSLLVFVSCGGGSSKPANESGGDSVSNFGKLGQECYPNETCDKGLICDTESNICIEDPENPINDSDKTDSGNLEKPDSDSDNGDSIPDDGDTQSDGGDTVPDSSDITPDGGDSQPDTDTTPDDGDSAPDSDNTGTANDNPANLPECSPTSATPCIDSEVLDADSEKAYLIWSGKSPERLRWADAVEYCSKLDEGGFNDWQFPTLAALKTLLRSGTYCELGDNCSKFGEITFFWSSSKGYGIDFYSGIITSSKNVDESFDVRCVRKEITSRHVNCTGLPATAQWNSVSEITQTWDWGSLKIINQQDPFSTSVDYGSLSWTPSPVSVISDEPSTTECRFKCNEGLVGSKCNLTCEEFKARDNVLCKSDCSTCGCKPGYVWVGELASYYVDTGGDPDYNCIPCTASEMLVEMIRNRVSYCPGGDDLKDKFSTDTSLSNQIEKCPQYTRPTDLLDDCYCPYGHPPPPKEDCHPLSTRKKQ